METRPKRAAVRKGAKDDEGATKNPASRLTKSKTVDKKAGTSGGSGDHATAPPKATKGTKAPSKITVSKGRVKFPEKKAEQDVNSDSAGSSPEAGTSRVMPPTPYPNTGRIDFSSSPENSDDDGMQEDFVEPAKREVTNKATATKAKAASNKAEEPMDDDEDSDKEVGAGNVSGPKDEEAEKPKNAPKKTKPAVKKVAAKPKVGSKRAAPPLSPKPDAERDESFDEVVPAEPEVGSSPEKGKKVTATAVRKGPVKGKAAAKKTVQKAVEEVDEDSGSNDEVGKPEPKGKGKKAMVATKTVAAGPKGKKTSAEEVEGHDVEYAETKPFGKGPKVAAKVASKEALTGDKKTTGGKGKVSPVKNKDVIDASSDEEGNNAAPMDSSTEDLAMKLGVLNPQKKPVAAKSSPPKSVQADTSTTSPGSKSGNDEEAISDSDRSSSGSGSDNKENDLDVVMDNLQIVSEESGPDNAAVSEPEPTPEPPKKRAAAIRKKQPEPQVAPPKPKAGPSAANRGAKNRTMPATFDAAKATAAEDLKKNLLARKSYATRSKAKAKVGTSATATAATTKTKK